MVNMSDELKKQFYSVNLDEYVELKREIVPRLKQKINQLELKIKELESKLDGVQSFLKKVDKLIFNKTGSHACNIGPIETAHLLLENDEKRKKQLYQIEQENKEAKDEIISLKELLGKGTSGWEIISDVAIGINPFTGEKEQFDFPKNFDDDKSKNLHFTDEKFYMCRFKYYPDENDKVNFEEHDMPITLYRYLSKSSKSKALDIYDVKSWEQMKDYIYSIGNIPRGRYIERVGRFLIKRRMESGKFTAEELDRECGFKKNRKTRRDYCKKFIKWGFIEETKKEGVYKIIF